MAGKKKGATRKIAPKKMKDLKVAPKKAIKVKGGKGSLDKPGSGTPILGN